MWRKRKKNSMVANFRFTQCELQPKNQKKKKWNKNLRFANWFNSIQLNSWFFAHNCDESPVNIHKNYIGYARQEKKRAGMSMFFYAHQRKSSFNSSRQCIYIRLSPPFHTSHIQLSLYFMKCQLKSHNLSLTSFYEVAQLIL